MGDYCDDFLLRVMAQCCGCGWEGSGSGRYFGVKESKEEVQTVSDLREEQQQLIEIE